MKNKLSYLFFCIFISLFFITCKSDLSQDAVETNASLILELKEVDSFESEEITTLLKSIVDVSNSLPLNKMVVNDTERMLSAEKGHLLLSILESSLNKEQLDYVYQKANFSGAYIQDATIENAYLVNILLSDSYFSKVKFVEADFSKATLMNSIINKSIISKSNFTKTNCRNLDFSGSEINKTSFEMAYLRDAIFIRTTIGKIELEGANISGTTLDKLADDVQISVL